MLQPIVPPKIRIAKVKDTVVAIISLGVVMMATMSTGMFGPPVPNPANAAIAVTVLESVRSPRIKRSPEKALKGTSKK